MPSPYSYTNRRRVLMQVVLLAILAAMIGLAALVRHRRITTPPTPLSPPIPLGLYTVAVPKGWKVTREWRKVTPSLPLDGLRIVPPVPQIEALDSEGGRRLEILQDYLAYPITPESYLETFHGTEGLEPRPITMAGQPGIAVEGVAVREGKGWTNVTWHQYAVTVTEEHVVLLLHLESPGRNLTASDRKLFGDLISKVSRRVPAG